MSSSKRAGAVCLAVCAVTLVIAVLFCTLGQNLFEAVEKVFGYESRLFDTSFVHTVDIVMTDWEGFIDGCEDEEYVPCGVIIDGESIKNVGIRAKGNTSLSQVKNYGNDRYSFKIEFDHYETGRSYYGLDKLSLNNIIQDNTYMKDYLCYEMMRYAGAASPLCSYAYITVNGEDFGLYLAVEGVEESFLERNYGADYGELYKPDSSDMGGGRGFGGDFEIPEDLGGEITKDLDGDGSQNFDGEMPKGFGGEMSDGAGNGGTAPDFEASFPNRENGGSERPGGSRGDFGRQEGNMDGPSDMKDGVPSIPNGDMPEMPGESNTSPTVPDGEDLQVPNGGTGDPPALPEGESPQMPNGDIGDVPSIPEGEMPDTFGDNAPDGAGGFKKGENDGGKGNFGTKSDVSLIYSDDDADSYPNIFDNAKTDVTDSDKERLISSLKKLNENEDIENVVDTEAVIRYFAVHNFVCNFDSYTGSMIHNYYLYEKDGKMQMIPWDYNLAFGGFESGSDATSLVNYPIDSPVSGGDVSSRPMLAWIFESDEYTERYHAVMSEFISEYFESGYFESEIERVMGLISPYVEKDPTKFCTYAEFEKGVSTLTEFCLLRSESIRGQLEGTVASLSSSGDDAKTGWIDASHITVSDMGSMMGGKRGGSMTPGSR